MTLKPTDIEALVELFDKSDWDEVHIEIDGEEILLSKDSRRNAGAVVQPVASAAPVAAAPVAASASPAAVATGSHGASAPAGAARGANWVPIKAANLGTFYKASSPDAAPYVTLGASVTAETEVCMIEVMKLFTTIRAGMAGIVREICVQDGQMVEYGQDLMWIEPV
jgi:acetyl-CoA carboxylase biotin carboxyl carrier protein